MPAVSAGSLTPTTATVFSITHRITGIYLVIAIRTPTRPIRRNKYHDYFPSESIRNAFANEGRNAMTAPQCSKYGSVTAADRLVTHWLMGLTSILCGICWWATFVLEQRTSP